MTTAGFSLSPDEIAAVCGKLRARIDDVGDLLADLLREYEALGHDLADRLESTLAAYRLIDSAVADTLGPDPHRTGE